MTRCFFVCLEHHTTAGGHVCRQRLHLHPRVHPTGDLARVLVRTLRRTCAYACIRAPGSLAEAEVQRWERGLQQNVARLAARATDSSMRSS